MNLRRSLIVILYILALSLSAVSAQRDGETLTVRLNDEGFNSIDPIFAGDLSSQQALHQLYVGLTRIDPITNTVVPGIVESWSQTPFPDNIRVYRFNMRENIPWVRYDPELNEVVQVTDAGGRARMVTHQDAVYGLLRALDSEFATENSMHLAEIILNGVEYVNGEVTADDIGISVNVDDFTITVNNPHVDLPRLLTEVQFVPQPAWLIEERGNDWAQADNFVSYGPYALFSWTTGGDMTLITNPYWQGTDAIPRPNIDNLTFTFLTDEDALLAYDAGELDMIVNAPTTDMTFLREQYPDEFTQYPRAQVHFFGVNLRENYATTDPNVRQALAQSIDLEALADIITSSGNMSATRFVPAPTSDADGVDVSTLGFNLSQAQSALARVTGDDISIGMVYLNTPYYATLAQAVAEQWETQLGIEIELYPQDAEGSIVNREFAAVWLFNSFADTPMSDSYFAPFVTGEDLSVASTFEDEAYDATFNEAFVTIPPEVDGQPVAPIDRTPLISTLETTLIDNVIVIPISWEADNELTKPYVQRTPTHNGLRSFEQWLVSN